mgnify:CR=1 FL=1
MHVWKGHQDVPEPYVRAVSGSQMVLFLVKPKPTDQANRSDSKSPAWLPASYLEHGGFKVSVVWIERGEAYAFKQVFNPGPSVLTRVGIGIDMKAKVVAFSVIQANLNKAVEEKDALSAAQSLRAFSGQGYHYGAKGCIESLGKMGNAAVPTLCRLLGDRTLSHWHPDIISAMVAAGGVDVASDLTAVVKEGLEYWQERLPKLKKGWWNNAPDNERRSLRSRYGRLLAALRAIRPLRYEPCREVVSSLRDLWRSSETLSDVGGDQMARACDAVLEELTGGPSAP